MSLSNTEEKDIKKSFFKRILANKKAKTGLMSAIGGVIIMIILQVVGSVTGITSISDLGMISGIMVLVIPSAMIHMKEAKRRDNIDRNLPFFLLALSGAVKSGKHLIRAIEDSADRNMGMLTPELKNLRANLSWGMPTHEAFEIFSDRVGTRMSKRVMVLISLAMDIGGDIADTLDVIQKHVTEMANVEKERKAALQPYIFTIYISFAVFLGITVILVTQFFTEVQNVQDALEASVGDRGAEGIGNLGSLLGINIPKINTVVFHMTLVEAIFGGLAAGKIGESSIVAGIKHVVLLVIITVVVFLLIGVSL